MNGGVLLGLNELNELRVNSHEATVDVGPGNKWVDVYNALAPYGRYAIGGRLKSIGVPGLTLIGGVGYFLNKYGFSMDNVVRYDVVLGNGTQVKASQNYNSDLFWALKGGANNYGIVTKFVLRTFYVPRVASTYQVFNESYVYDFIKAACHMVMADDGATGAGAVVNINYNTTTDVATPQVFGLQERTKLPPSRFSDFTDIPAQTRVHNITEPAVWHSQFETPNQMFRYGLRKMYMLLKLTLFTVVSNSVTILSDRTLISFFTFINYGGLRSKTLLMFKVSFPHLF